MSVLARGRRRGGALVLGGAVLTIAVAANGASDSSPLRVAGSHAIARIRHAVGASDLVAPAGYKVLERGAHPMARPEFDEGRLESTKRLANLAIAFKPSAAQVKDRETLLADIQNPGSPSFHKWLTPESYRARFGATDADVARTIAWLKTQGFEVGTTSRLGTRVNFSGTVAQFEAAFKTEMHKYRVGAELHYATATAPMVPSSLADVIMTVHNAHDFYAKPGLHPSKPDPMSACIVYDKDAGITSCSNGENGNLAPSDWATIYDVSPLYTSGTGSHATIDGTGVTIGIVGVAAILQSDVTAYRTTYEPGVTSPPITMTLIPGTGAAKSSGDGSGMEAILDVEWSGGIARGATVNFLFTGADDGNVDDAAFYAIEENLVPILSESFGGAEAGTPASEADFIQVNGAAAALLGITYMASAGDQGAAGGEGGGGGTGGLWVSLPAAYPNITSVGGTQFGTDVLTFAPDGSITGEDVDSSVVWNAGAATGYPDGGEWVWNESDNPDAGLGAGGGGISSLFTLPSYQQGLSCTPLGTLPAGSATGMRLVPDVSFSAASGVPGYLIECSLNADQSDCITADGGVLTAFPIGGTSASSPSFAGVVALLNQATGGRLGSVNPLLYELYKTNPAAFHDVTKGNNNVVCTPNSDPGCPAGGVYGFAAGPGFDCASGLGSLDVAKLVSIWASLAPTSTTVVATPASTTEGQSVSLTATIATDGGVASFDGSVSFAFESYLANGSPDMAWTLASSVVSGTTATASVTIPPGMVNPAAQYVNVIAEYGGDPSHMGSTSPKTKVSFAPLTLCTNIGSTAIDAGATLTLTGTGGVGPTTFNLYDDTGCSYYTGKGCSSLDDAGVLTTTTTGSYILVQAVDNDNAETWVEVTVGTPKSSSTAPWADDAGILTNPCATTSTDAGADGAKDAAADTGLILTVPDAGEETDAGTTTKSKGGCSCTTASTTTSSPLGAIAGLALAFGLAFRRRKSH